MWKPGTAKPSSSRATTADSLMPKQSSPKVPSSNGSAKKSLSGATMGMRFMQKRNQQQQQSQSPRRFETQQHDGQEGETTLLAPIVGQGSAADAAVEPTSSDMFGIQSELIGRRSFGGFKPKVNNNWQDCRKYLAGEENEEKRGNHVSDEELLQRYQELLKGRSDHDKASRTKKRKKSPGPALGLNKKGKP
jgi:M-phase phosphoprotein 6